MQPELGDRDGRGPGHSPTCGSSSAAISHGVSVADDGLGCGDGSGGGGTGAGRGRRLRRRRWRLGGSTSGGRATALRRLFADFGACRRPARRPRRLRSAVLLELVIRRALGLVIEFVGLLDLRLGIGSAPSADPNRPPRVSASCWPNPDRPLPMSGMPPPPMDGIARRAAIAGAAAGSSGAAPAAAADGGDAMRVAAGMGVASSRWRTPRRRRTGDRRR